MNRPSFSRQIRHAVATAAAFLGIAATVPGAARADLVFSVQSVSANPGSSGALDVLLTNTGASAATIGGFSFRIATSPSTSDISFTQATTSTTANPYVFAGHSLFGPVLNVTTGSFLDANDVYDASNAGATLASGATLALGHVSYSVASNATPRSVNVSLTTSAFTSVADQNGATLASTILSPAGSIRINGATAVPEPTIPALSAILAIAALSRKALRSRNATAV